MRNLALTPDQEALLLREMHKVEPEYLWFIETLLNTGMRFGEASALQVQDVDLGAKLVRFVRAYQNDGTGTLILGPTKGKKSREVPLPERLRPYVQKAMVGKKPQDLLLTTPKSAIIRGSILRRDIHWHALAQSIGKPKLRFHDLRHTAAVTMLEQGIAVHDVRSILGHADLATTNMYTGSHADYATRAAEKMDGTSRGA